MNQYVQLSFALNTKLKAGQAILAINVQSIQQIEILANISEKLNKFIILQFSAKYIPHFDKLIGIKNILDKYKFHKYLFFHLDHCMNEELIFNCIDWKFDSIMFDGSNLEICENIKRTKDLTLLAHDKGVLVEGEVGIISGVEDGFGAEGGSVFNLNEALSFYNETKVDLLALGIGNAHGMYKSSDNVNIDLLSIFQNHLIKSKACLVLHGATGLHDKQVSDAIEYGVVKVNYSTELKILYQSIINQISSNQVHDEIYFYNLLKKNLEPIIEKMIYQMENNRVSGN